MTNLIKQAIVYKAEIPRNTVALIRHLDERRFAELLQAQSSGAGFVPLADDRDLVEAFHGGLAFRVRIDAKVLPASVIAAATNKAIAALGRKASKTERAQIKDEVTYELTCNAFSRTVASITCFYHFATGFLIVPTTSKKIADACVTQLIMAVGSVTTETIHVSNVKKGLTSRLKKWLNEESDAFGCFDPCDEAALVSDKRKITVKMDDLESARVGLLDALDTGFGVNSLGFHHQGNDFRLSHDFRFRGIRVAAAPDSGDNESRWEADAALEVDAVCDIVTELCEMMAYSDTPVEA